MFYARIDKLNRLAIPKKVVDSIKLNDKREVMLDYNEITHELVIKPANRLEVIDLINQRLNKKDLRISERNFLEKIRGQL